MGKRLKYHKLELWMITDRQLVSDLPAACGRVWKDIDCLILREKDWTLEETQVFFERLSVYSEKDKHPVRRLLNWTMNFEPWSLPIDGLHIGAKCAKDNWKMLQIDSQIRNQMVLRHWCLGISIHSLKEWREVEQLRPDYLVISNIFETDCKPGKLGMGLESLESLISVIKINRPDIVLIGLGGLNKKHLSELETTGLKGIALRSALHAK
jgi:thiamine monophosphate synthase